MRLGRTEHAIASAVIIAAAVPQPGTAQLPDSSRKSDLDRAIAVPTAQLIRAHTRFLSDDLLGGRATGTRGAQLAATYIAAQFEAVGLAPAAPDGSYFHRFPLSGIRSEPSIIVGVGTRTTALAYPDEYVARPLWPQANVTADAEIVFAGYGISTPEWQWDDFGDAPVTGKILMVLANDPGLTDWSRFEGRRLTYYGTSSYKLEQAARLGAVGVLLVHSEESALVPWSAIQNSWLAEQLLLPERPTETLRFAGWLSEGAARRIVGAAGKNFDALVLQAQAREFQPIPLGAHAVVHFQSTVRATEGVNVVAKLAPRDAAQPAESVVLMAHYDHLGVGRPVDGDSIYNGAIDNASGVATLLAAGAGLARGRAPERRSVVFLATSGAESGFLGARALVADGGMALERIAALVNIDGANVAGVTRGAVAVGADLSTLGAYFDSAARDEGLIVGDDPAPERGFFYRSDHLPFAEAGIPVLYLRSGHAPPDSGGTGAREIEPGFVWERYHQPSDELDAELSFEGAAQQARLMIRLASLLGRAREFPAWFPDAPYRPQGERLRLRRARGRP